MSLAQSGSPFLHSRRPAFWRRLLLIVFLFPALTGLPQDDDESKAQVAQALRHVGQWVWSTQTFDKQTIHLWRAFAIPHGARVSNATIYITVDNGYRLFLDGREVGRGSDWKTLTQYDVKSLLAPGNHVLSVEAFNDRLAGGLMFGMKIQMPGRAPIDIRSDDTWKVVPLDDDRWLTATRPSPAWAPVAVEGKAGEQPWTPWPYAVVAMPPLEPLVFHFWQRLWFQILLLSLLSVAVFSSLWLMTQLAAQSKGQRFLQMERARIARDIHDDLGAQLTQLVLQGEVAQREQPADSQARAQFNQICERAREISRAMGEVVWAVNSRRDTVRDFVTYVCKFATTFLADTAIRCRLDLEQEIPALHFDLPTRRNLFLAVKEALNNVARHSGADELFLRIRYSGERLIVIVEDNGHGFDPVRIHAGGNGVENMIQRMAETGGICNIVSQPGAGCVVTFVLQLKHTGRRPWFARLRRRQEEEAETHESAAIPNSLNAHHQ